MVRAIVFTVFISLLSFFVADNANAEVVSAGEPDVVRVQVDPFFLYPDIYARQFKYRETYNQLIADLKARQHSYIAPHLEAKNNYKKELKALHRSIKNDQK